MVEVFKTNIVKQKQANDIISKLTEQFPGYKINFDLEDCDHILRVENLNGKVDIEGIIILIKNRRLYIETLTHIVTMQHREDVV